MTSSLRQPAFTMSTSRAAPLLPIACSPLAMPTLTIKATTQLRRHRRSCRRRFPDNKQFWARLLGQAGRSNHLTAANDLSNYTFVSTTDASLTANAAHDGPLGLSIASDTEWMYRNDATVHVAQGQVISTWVRSEAVVPSGRAYVGFGASATGALSLVMGGNTGQLILENNASFGFNVLNAVNQTWLANHWYRFEITWGVGGAIPGKLYDSDGTTLLNTVTATDNTITSGGLAFRGFGNTLDFDTVTDNAAGVHSPTYKVQMAA